MSPHRGTALLLAGMVACAGSDKAPSESADPRPPEDTGSRPGDTSDTRDTSDTGEPLSTVDAPRLARRLSLDLRGHLPSTDELDAVAADPTQLAVLRDAWLLEPAFEGRLIDLLHEHFETRLDAFQVPSTDYGIAEADSWAYLAAVGEEPLRLAAAIVVEDRPWTDLTTQPHTMANGLLRELWPLALDEEAEAGSEWARSRYTDLRPAAGILASNGLWWRYPTSMSNLNRSRVAALSRLLLCADYLERPVSFDTLPSIDPEAAARAILEEPACIGCHSSIEPMAAAMFGFWNAIEYSALEMDTYHLEREPLGEEVLGVAPGYFGEPIGGLEELGVKVSEDPRFSRCAVQTFASLLWRRSTSDADGARLTELTDDFVAGGHRVRPLLAELVSLDAYRVGLDPTVEVTEGAPSRRLLSNDQLDGVLTELTGFTWTLDGRPRLRTDAGGFRVLAGGVDGDTTGAVQQVPGLTWALVDRQVAEAAAGHVVHTDLRELGEGPGLLTVSPEAVPGDPDFDAQLQALHWRLMADPDPDGDRLAVDAALWSTVAAEHGPEVAWHALLTALLRDPDFITY